jgi:excisionase family DNA binding protein
MTSGAAHGQSEGTKASSDLPQRLHAPSVRATGPSALPLLTAEDLAARWQVPKQHVYRLARTEQIPTIRLGRYYRFRLDAIEAWEEKQPHV